MRFINRPTPIPPEAYEALLDKLTGMVVDRCSPVAVCQIGSVSHPGISDLDVMVIFEEGQSCTLNIRPMLSEYENNILTHGLFGTTEELLKLSKHYSLFSNYKILYSSKLEVYLPEDSLLTDKVKGQIALEYLIRLWIALSIQLHYGVLKLRSLLLEINALKYDLELLGIGEGRLYEMVHELIGWRSRWFDQAPTDEQLKKWFSEFVSVLGGFIRNVLQSRSFYLPASHISIARNIQLFQDENLHIYRKGFRLPSVLSHLSTKYLSLMNRINSFEVGIPFDIVENKQSRIFERFSYLKKHNEYSRIHLPYFGNLGTSLRLDEALKTIAFDGEN